MVSSGWQLSMAVDFFPIPALYLAAWDPKTWNFHVYVSILSYLIIVLNLNPTCPLNDSFLSPACDVPCGDASSLNERVGKIEPKVEIYWYVNLLVYHTWITHISKFTCKCRHPSSWSLSYGSHQRVSLACVALVSLLRETAAIKLPVHLTKWVLFACLCVSFSTPVVKEKRAWGESGGGGWGGEREEVRKEVQEEEREW